MFRIFFIYILFIFVGTAVFAADDFVPEDEENNITGTSSTDFIIDSADEGGDLQLQFGDTLGEYLKWISVDGLFELSDSLRIGGNLDITENIFTFDSDNVGVGADVRIIANQGSDSAGELRYNAADNQWEFSNDGGIFTPFGSGGSSGGGTGEDILGQYYDGSGGLDVNVNPAVAIGWDQEVREDSGITHDTVTNNSRVILDTASWYQVSYTVAYQNTSNNRKTIGCFLQLDGTTQVPGSLSYSYSRTTTDNFGSNSATVIFETTSANQYYEILCDRNGTAGTTTLVANGSGTTVLKLDNNGGTEVPYISSTGLSMQPSSTKNISIIGLNFTPESLVSFPGFPGTINTITVVSPTQIDVNVTSTATTGVFDIVVTTDGVDNTVWSGNAVGEFSVQLVSGTGSAGTYTEGFEADLGSWVDSGLDVTWTRDSGGTPSGSTGPNVASVGTFYMFTEASNPNFPGVTFGLETTDFAVAQSIAFDYHMFGADMGTLELQTLRSGVWTTRQTIAGQQQAAQGDAYLNQFVDLSSFEVEGIRFFYTSGTNYTGDCTIDNVVIISS